MSESTPATATTKEQLLEHMRRFLREERGIEPERVQLATRFREELDVDSLDLAEIFVRWESEFGEALDRLLETDAVIRIETIGEALDLAVELIQRSSGQGL